MNQAPRPASRQGALGRLRPFRPARTARWPSPTAGWRGPAATARAVRQRIRSVLEWAIAMDLRHDNPCDRVLPDTGRTLIPTHRDIALNSRPPLLHGHREALRYGQPTRVACGHPDIRPPEMARREPDRAARNAYRRDVAPGGRHSLKLQVVRKSAGRSGALVGLACAVAFRGALKRLKANGESRWTGLDAFWP